MNASTPQPALGSLPIGATIVQAWRLVWRSRDEILRIGAVPLLLSLGLTLAIRAWGSGASVFVGILLSWIPLSLFAVTWLRFLLRADETAAAGLATRWTRRESRFLLRIMALNLGTDVAVGVTIGIIALALGVRPDQSGGAFLMLIIIGGGVALYLMLRLSLILPATAIDAAYGFRDSWRDTAGCSLQLLAIVVVTDLPAGLLVLFLNSTRLALLLPYTLVLVTSVLGYLVFATTMTVLALAFRARSGAAGPPASGTGR